MGILSLKGWAGVSLLLTTVSIMYRYTVSVANREPVDYLAFWHNGLEGSSQVHLQMPFIGIFHSMLLKSSLPFSLNLILTVHY